MPDLKTRCINLLKALELPKTRFCKKIKISTQAFNAWLRGDLNLKDDTLQRIDEFLKKFNY